MMYFLMIEIFMNEDLKLKFSYFFEKNNLDFQELTVVRREINLEGKSRAFINDTPVLLNVLSELGNQIIEIHAQHQSILLKDEIAQFALIDNLAKSEKFLFAYQKDTWNTAPC